MNAIKNSLVILGLAATALLTSCDHVDNPYADQVSTDLDTTLYPGDWSTYVSTEWPTFTTNTNTYRNVLIEDFTGHKCIYCPAAADIAHTLHNANPERVFIATIHSGPSGIGDFQTTDATYPLDLTNTQGLEIGTFFGTNDPGFIGNPRGTVSRIYANDAIFQSPSIWSNMVTSTLSSNDLKVNIQSKLNYYEETHGAFLHTEVEVLDASLTNLSMVVYMIEDSLVADQKMQDNSHNEDYVHRDVMRGCIDTKSFGRSITGDYLSNGKYYLNYSFVVPSQLDGTYNPKNMHLVIYVMDKSSYEIYQVIEQVITE